MLEQILPGWPATYSLAVRGLDIPISSIMTLGQECMGLAAARHLMQTGEDQSREDEHVQDDKVASSQTLTIEVVGWTANGHPESQP